MGCGTCFGCCAPHAITMTYSISNRTYIPFIDEKKCIECGICLKVCPGLQMDNTLSTDEMRNTGIVKSIIGKVKKCYIGYSSDASICFNASSGGIVPALASFMLDTKAVDGVVAAEMDPLSPFDAKPIICKSRDDILKTTGSKYCPVATNSVMGDNQIPGLNSLLWIGLPCHIQGLCKARKYSPLKKTRSILSLGLLCGGCRGQEATKWIVKSRKHPIGTVKNVRYRGGGWPGKMKVEFKDNPAPLELPYSEYVDSYFESWQPWRCSLCLDRTSQMADISLGDAWLPEFKNDRNGISLIVTRTDAGEATIQKAAQAGAISIVEKDFDTIINAQKGLMRDCTSIIVPTLLLSRKLKRPVPDFKYDDSDSTPVNTVRIMRRFFMMAITRQMTQSRTLFFILHGVKFVARKAMLKK